MKKKYAVVGGSGEGKSTIAKLLMGFLTPQEGEIRINGIDIRQVREEELFAWLSYQEQHVAMLDDTIENNILLQRRVSKKQWQEVLQKSHVEEILTRNSFGEETQVGEHGKNLSGGERQRIGLARSLLSDTKFLIFDEPTASLDNENALQIEKNILSLSGIGALVITHRVPVEIMEQYDEIFVLDQGKIAEKGTCQELLQQQGKFYHLVYGRESVSPS
jgi:ATP-binding cassette subfamily C protein